MLSSNQINPFLLGNYEEILVKIADTILENEYESTEDLIENKTFHYIFKHVLDNDVKFAEQGLKSKTSCEILDQKFK